MGMKGNSKKKNRITLGKDMQSRESRLSSGKTCFVGRSYLTKFQIAFLGLLIV